MALDKTLWTQIVDLVSTGQNVSDKLDTAFNNLDTAIDQIDANTLILDDFSNAVGAETKLTGIISIEDIASVNTDIKKMDYLAFDCFIQGTAYIYAGGTAIAPTITTGDSSTWVGFDGAGLVYSEETFTSTQLLTILPIARLQTVQGQSGSGSDLQSPIHLTYSIGQDGFTDREWLQSTVGALYADGGTFIENSGTPLQVDQLEGSFHNAQRKHINVSAGSNIEASSLYSVSGVPTLQTRATLVIPKYYDNGTDIVALSANKFVSHTLLKSPKAEDLFFLIYGTQEYDSQSQAEKAKVSYGLFQGQALSGLFKVARFIVKGDSTNIEAIQDERPSWILENKSTGLGDLPPSYGGVYFSATAPTTISTIGVYVKIAGISTEIKSSADITASDNRFTYTGKTSRTFKVDTTTSITSVSNNQLIATAFAKNGSVITGSELQILGVATKVGAMPLTFLVEMSDGDYIEQWVVNYTSTSDVTAVSKSMNLISID